MISQRIEAYVTLGVLAYALLCGPNVAAAADVAAGKKDEGEDSVTNVPAEGKSSGIDLGH